MADTVPNDLETLINSAKIVLFVKQGCGFCTKAKAILDELSLTYTAYDVEEMEGGSTVKSNLLTRTRQRTVPNIFINGKHVGGCSHLEAMRTEGLLFPIVQQGVQHYDFDLIVVGGGSGGLASAKEAAGLNKKVAVIDYVDPTPHGTTWGLGGTCVNVGCIPKKLMHQAALHGYGIKDAPFFGWTAGDDLENMLPPIPVRHSWSQMVQNVTTHIKSLNWQYRVILQEKNVVYLNGRGVFLDDHTIAVKDMKGVVHTITSKSFVIAIGCRPNYPDNVPGAREYSITSDDLFSLSEPPGKTLIVGASYIALECAGFLAGVGFDVTVMVRSILLRGFDRQMSEMIGENLKNHGVKFIEGCVMKKIEPKVDDATNYRVTAVLSSGAEIYGDYNTVLFAMGRTACTSNMGLETVGVKLHTETKKILVEENDMTSVPNVYAIGDVAHGRIELTPVAIQAGRLLVHRLFNSKTQLMDYVNVATTVFTPLEYGCCGYSEESAIELYGKDNIEVYHNKFQPLEFTLSGREPDGCYGKLICLKSEEDRVIGFHMIGPNAGEVTQGFAIGLKLKAKKADFNDLVGIHPTCAEVFTTMRVSKSSGEAVNKTAC